MKISFTHPSRIFYNSSYNINKNDDTQMPQTFSGAKNPFLSELDALQNYNLSFLGKTTGKPVVAIDRNMKYKVYPSANKASVTLGISNPCILKCLADDESKRAKYAGDYCFALASEVQIEKEDGTVDIDKEKVKQIFETAEIARTEGANVKKRRFYGMNKDKKPIPFDGYAEAKEITGASRPNIIKCLNGSNKTACGYIFFKPEEIEIINDTGNMDFDKEKLDAVIKRAEEYLSNPYIAEKTAIYALYIGTENKKDIRFDKITGAISDLKISHRSINACLTGDSKFAGDYCFALASEIETIKEDGTVDINQDKIDKLKKEAKIAKENDTYMKGKAVYTLRIKDNSLKRYDISADAAKILEFSPANISACLAGRIEILGGFIFIPAYKIEVKNKDGILVPDEEKLKEALKEHHENAVAYRKERAAKRKGGGKQSKTSEKKTKVDIEKNKKVNEEKSPSASAVPPAITSQSTVAAPKLPHTVTSVPAPSTISDKIKKPLPKTTKQAEPETDKVKKPSEINRKIKRANLLESAQSHVAAPVSTPETTPTSKSAVKFPSQKTVIPDIKSKCKKTTPKLASKPAETPVSTDGVKEAKKYKRLGRIYAYDSNGNYFEYKDLFDASNKLSTDINSLYKIIKKNKSLFGLVFTTDSDY